MAALGCRVCSVGRHACERISTHLCSVALLSQVRRIAGTAPLRLGDAVTAPVNAPCSVAEAAAASSVVVSDAAAGRSQQASMSGMAQGTTPLLVLSNALERALCSVASGVQAADPTHCSLNVDERAEARRPCCSRTCLLPLRHLLDRRRRPSGLAVRPARTMGRKRPDNIDDIHRHSRRVCSAVLSAHCAQLAKSRSLTGWRQLALLPPASERADACKV
jgi:hypothetical protein